MTSPARTGSALTDGSARTGFSRVGGDVALDLLNTVASRLAADGGRDLLEGYADVVAWCRGAEIIDLSEAAALVAAADRAPLDAAAELVRVRDLREMSYEAVMSGDGPAGAQLAASYREAVGEETLVRRDGAWRWQASELGLATPRHRLAHAVTRLLTSERLGLVYQCEDETCGRVFLDTSPRRNRVWCAADTCGNRNRVRRHYYRRRQS